MGLFKKKQLDEKYAFSTYPHLVAVKPKEKYVFHSDYIKIDNQYQTIMAFFHRDNVRDRFPAFWGVNLIPTGLDEDIVVMLFEQTRRMTENWIDKHQNQSEAVAKSTDNEQQQGGTKTGQQKAGVMNEQLEVIAEELSAGASYLNVHYRLIVKAPTLDKLDKAVGHIATSYVDRFSTVNAAAYHGEQRRELSTMFAKNQFKKGKGFYFTSVEHAGAYNLVTNGLADFSGEYVGVMRGDVNNSAVLLDVNDFKHHVVIANENRDPKLDYSYITDLWGSKLSQSCMINNGKVVHIILNDCKLEKLGPGFNEITYKIDMNTGDVNMFEMFGDIKDELSIFSTHMTKLKLMAEQAYDANEHDIGVIRGSLEEIATMFYIDRKMWYENAKENRHKLRIVGIPHGEVPRLQDFVTYLDVMYKSLASKKARDNEKLHAISTLNYTFKNLLSNNGDLFNTITNDEIDGAKTGVRVIYDFSNLAMRGTGIAMAQLVNVIGFAVGNLGRGDLLIIHGADRIDKGVKDYLSSQFDRLYAKNGRIAFLYNDIDKMLDDKALSKFDQANYTIFGTMTPTIATKYQKMLGQVIPADLISLITSKSSDYNYIRRDFDNVVFQLDLLLNLPKKKKKKKKKSGVR